jgi:uncharacterized membrane protein YhiD involved in acid resistance
VIADSIDLTLFSRADSISAPLVSAKDRKLNTDQLLAESQGIAISIVDLVMAMSVAMILGLFIVFVYRVTHRGLNYERSFLVTLLMMSPMVGLVIMLIGSNLALSLGLVGALSIIRFRNVIKDSRDMAYLFWSITVGLGSGTYNWTVVLVASILFAAVLLTLYFLEFGKTRANDYVLVISGEGEQPADGILDLIKNRTEQSGLRTLDIHENGWELVLELRMTAATSAKESELLTELKSLDGVRKTSLLAPQLALPI